MRAERFNGGVDHNRAGGAGQKRRNGARDGFQQGGRLRFRGCNG